MRDGQGNKTVGGSMTAKTWDEAADIATRNLVPGLTSSGREVFKDNKGREVFVYISIYPADVPKHAAGISNLKTDRRQKRDAAEKEESNQQKRLDAILDGMSTADAIAALSK